MSQHWQAFLAAVSVLFAFGYSGWVFMPSAWRYALKLRCGVKPSLSPNRPGCSSACSACNACAASPAHKESVITIHACVNALSSKATE